MKILHLADLHIGKRVNEFSMLADQEYVLRQILAAAAAEKPQAVLLCGDIYDKPQPPAEAVQLFDRFLTELAEVCPAVLIIPGNHDSAERLSFAADILKRQGVYLAAPFTDSVPRVRLNDEFGAVDFWLLPYVKPVQVRRCYEDAADITTYDEAIARIMQEVHPEPGIRAVLLAHQLLTGAQTCESEELAIGGQDNVSAGRFGAFCYVALGHLHQAQQVERPEIRYAGSPLKYSFSEARHKKSITLVNLAADGRAEVSLLPLAPLHDMRELKGSFAELVKGEASEDYLHITLTDEEDILDATARLRQVYPNLMKLDYDNRRTGERRKSVGAAVTGKSPLELFAEFYKLQNNQPLKDEQSALLAQLIEEIWEDAPKGGAAL